MSLEYTGGGGLWENPEWDKSKPGAFAVVIGVSQYSHLDGTAGCYNLQQLEVSALTAFDFLQWLKNQYKLTGVPLARCWFLASPTEDEKEQRPDVVKSELPTMNNCIKAIHTWYSEMKAMDESVAEHCQSFFFYSGHGLQVTEDKQILLPYDYLGDVIGNVNEALSTWNLSVGLRSLEVRNHFFFLDACRNDHTALKEVAELEGRKVLNELNSSKLNRKARVPILYAAETGTRAFQPGRAAMGPSIYGQALLDGLGAHPFFKAECDAQRCVIKMYHLEEFLGPRMQELIKKFGATVDQTPELSGKQTSSPLTEVSQRPIDDSVHRMRSVQNYRGPRQSQTKVIRNWTGDNFAQAHSLFGSETISIMWLEAELHAFANMDPENAVNKGKPIKIHEVNRSEDSSSFTVDFSILEDYRTYWLKLRDPSGTFFGSVLPWDEYGQPRYSLELQMSERSNDAPRQVTSISVSPSVMSGHKYLSRAAKLWSLYKNRSTQRALKSKEMRELENILREKVTSPLGATISALVLLRTGEDERLHNWLRNVANWFPYLPDGPVLWVEQMMNLSEEPLHLKGANDRFMENKGHWDGEPRHVIDYLLELEKRGLPYTGDTLGYAHQLIDEFLTFGELTKKEKTMLSKIQNKIKFALKFHRPSGLFCVYASQNENDLHQIFS